MTAKMRIANIATAAAMVGLVGGAGVMVTGCMGSSSPAPTTSNSCKGQNACKGQGNCKTADHSCKGQNACKGQGGCKAM